MINQSLIRNLVVFGSLATLLLILAGCPQAQSDPPPAVTPPAADSATRGNGNPSTAEPTTEPDAPPAGQAANRDTNPLDTPNEVQATEAEVQQPYAADQAAPKEPLFVDWPTPQAAIVLSGRQHGYIEPCGCTGLANQKGGLARRHTLFQQLAEKGWQLAPLDAGNQVRRFGRQAEIKFQTTTAALRELGYRAVGLGPDDLRLSFGELVAPLLEEGPDGKSMFVSANVNLLDQLPAFKMVEVGGKKIAVTTLLGKEGQMNINAAEIELGDPEEKLAAVAAQMKEVDCDLRILLAQASDTECEAWAKKYPVFDMVVSAGFATEPGHDFLPIEGSQTKLVNLGAKGMHVIVIGLYDDEAKPLRYQRVPLDDRFEDSADMLRLMASYQTQLETLGLEGLGLRPVNHASGNTFVGSATCADCHDEAYEIWENGPHHHATESLVHPGERSEIQRHFDPECLSCHVTGWNPQGYYPYKSGYLALEASKHLHGNGCENCHGPGSKHVAVELGELTVSDEEQEKLRQSMRVTLDEARKSLCMTCHDLDNSPDFHKPGAFEEYWERIKH